MKRFLAAFLILAMMFSLTACFSSSRRSSSSSSSSKSSKSSHSCYVCGKSASLKYGSHYYCKTHWAMVKTVAEAD